MNEFTIRDLENLSGIKAHTIRIWEQRYSFLKPKRTETNIRTYSNEELKVILNIALLNKYGYRISQIDQMNEPELKQKILSLNSAEALQDKVVNTLIQCMVDLDMERFETSLDHFIFSQGIEQAITQVIFPFLERIGILWMTSHINPAQEHLVSNIIRQKIIVGIEGTLHKSSSGFARTQGNKMIVLFLPESEHHELGLLYTYYLLKSRGINTLYLGADLPLKDLTFVARLKKPDFIYTHLSARPRRFNLPKFIERYAAQIAGIPLIISGQIDPEQLKAGNAPVQFKTSIKAVQEFIGSL